GGLGAHQHLLPRAGALGEPGPPPPRLQDTLRHEQGIRCSRRRPRRAGGGDGRHSRAPSRPHSRGEGRAETPQNVRPGRHDTGQARQPRHTALRQGGTDRVAEEIACGDPASLKRYDRQLPILGEEGQRRLAQSKVAIVGAGGLGSVVSYYLAAAGVGTLRIIDSDTVAEDNLNRQILYDTPAIGLPKAILAAHRLRALNPCVHVEPITERVTRENAHRLLQGVDLIIDCLDNWPTRLILDDYAHQTGTPLLHAAVESYYGQLLLVIPGRTPSLKTIAPRQPPPKRKIPVLGPAVATIAALQASLAIQYLTGQAVEPGTLHLIDAWNMETTKIKLQPY
ncbi:MAG: HesA/MoeB/ThiF family protein, partial [Crenarchaeota archaeon]|nr:HesA/MoeB/ThiF family protein [Thermoproteota archaeon]